MRVLLVRLDGVGDAAVCTPLLAALIDAGHEVGIVLSTRNAGLFRPDALLAEHVLERIPWPAHGSTPASSAAARGGIAAVGYDVALIASEEPEAFALAAPVAQRVGFVTGWERPLKTLWVRARTTRHVRRSQRIGGEPAHEAEILFRLGRGLVATAGPPADAVRLRRLLTSAAPSGGGPVVLQAGPKWAATGVSRTVLRELSARLAPRGLRVVCAAAEAEVVRETLGLEPEWFAARRDWVDALAGAAAVVTVDTGAAHVAGMLGTPVVDVFPDAQAAAQIRRWRPWASPYRVLRAAELNGAGAARVEAALDEF